MKQQRIIQILIATIVFIVTTASTAYANGVCKCKEPYLEITISDVPCSICAPPGARLEWAKKQPEWPGITPVPGPDVIIRSCCDAKRDSIDIDSLRCHVFSFAYLCRAGVNTR